jgi:hypothetical protein
VREEKDRQRLQIIKGQVERLERSLLDLFVNACDAMAHEDLRALLHHEAAR